MKKTFYLLSIAILASACSNTLTSSDDQTSQTEITAIADTVSSIGTVEKTDTIDTYEKLKERDRQIMQDILKKRKTLQ